MKPLLTVLAVVLLFAAGAAGTYFMMPVVAPEKVAQARHYLDSLDAVAAGDSAFLARLDSLRQPAAPAPADSAQADTLAAPAEAPADTTTTPAVADAAETPAIAQAEAAQAEQARELSNVISKLEDPELRALVTNLDPDVLAILYRESSARNKTRLLQAIPPDRAAAFVRGLIVPVGQK